MGYEVFGIGRSFGSSFAEQFPDAADNPLFHAVVCDLLDTEKMLKLVRGIAALSGSVLPVLKAELKPDESLDKLAIFIGHGTLDQALPYVSATRANEVLTGLGLKPEFHGYPGMPHTISDAEVQDLNAWLEKSLR